MTRRGKLWAWAAGIYAFINVAGLAYAAAEEQEMHAMLHLFLLLLGLAAFFGWWIARRGVPRQEPSTTPIEAARVEYLQQSVDAMALELERIGEAQRFNDKLRVQKGETPPLKKDQ
jgi:hypothetical protein